MPESSCPYHLRLRATAKSSVVPKRSRKKYSHPFVATGSVPTDSTNYGLKIYKKVASLVSGFFVIVTKSPK